MSPSQRRCSLQQTNLLRSQAVHLSFGELETGFVPPPVGPIRPSVGPFFLSDFPKGCAYRHGRPIFEGPVDLSGVHSQAADALNPFAFCGCRRGCQGNSNRQISECTCACRTVTRAVIRGCSRLARPICQDQVRKYRAAAVFSIQRSISWAISSMACTLFQFRAVPVTLSSLSTADQGSFDRPAPFGK